MSPLAFAVLAATAAPTAPATERRPLQLGDLFGMHRLSDPQISPDGKTVAYVVTDVDMAENRTNSDIWLASAERIGETGAAAGTAVGAAPRALTRSPKHDRHPRWSPDGRWIAFESNRDGDFQIWVIPTSGGEARKLTTLSTGATQPVWSPDGGAVAFVSAVYPEFSDKPFGESDRLNKEALEARDKSKVKARVLTQLLYRHWDDWVDGKRQHLFVVPVKDGAAAGDPRDVTPGDNDAVPTSSTFSAGDEFAFSPDGKELVFCAPPLPVREQAWSTNHDLWSVDLSTGARRQLTTNPAADGLPRFSPDGRLLAYRAQARPGFEADRWQLMVLDRASGRHRSLTAGFDASIDELVWSPDGRQIFFEAQDKGTRPLWVVPIAGGAPRALVSEGAVGDVRVSSDGRWLAFTHTRLTRPAEVSTLRIGDTALQPLTRANDDLLAAIEMNAAESVTVTGAGGTPLQMWIVKPPRFDPAKKYPLVFWVHGGPQSAFLDAWSARWNPQVWAAQGYVVALPNPRGSTGFGQKFTDEISRDWGGKVFEDLMAGLAYLEKQPYVDVTRMAAAGASYGGYMMNWFQGHTDKFKTLVTHCGVYNYASMYGTTEETWFVEWDLGHPSDTDFERQSPHRYAAHFKTPNLVIHNELDFRVPIGEGLQLFTALQRKGVPSKLLYFPDEGHWVLKPQNSELWHETIFEWLAVYLKS